MKLSVKILLIVTIFHIASCEQHDEISKPVIEILSPVENQQYILPDTVTIEFDVKHNSIIEYIKVSIDNSNYIPLTQHEFIYPSENNFKGKVKLALGTLSNSIKKPPYYIHITVGDLNDIHQEYLKVDLKNSELKNKGFCLVVDKGVDVLELCYYNSEANLQFTSTIEGNYEYSESSITSGSIIIATSLPHLCRSFDFMNGELKWKDEPQLPYPEYTGIKVDEDLVYLSTSIGRIIGLRAVGGLKAFTTKVLPDSIPNNICVTSKYLIADFTPRNSGMNSWVSYHKQTGSKFQVFQTNLETIDIQSIDNSKVLFFCNDLSKGVIITFDIESNLIEQTVSAPDILVHHISRIDNNNFILSDERSILVFNQHNNSFTKILETEFDIIDMKYDTISNQINLAYNNMTEIISYPNLIITSTILSDYSIQAMELVHGY